MGGKGGENPICHRIVGYVDGRMFGRRLLNGRWGFV